MCRPLMPDGLVPSSLRHRATGQRVSCEFLQWVVYGFSYLVWCVVWRALIVVLALAHGASVPQ